MASEVRRDDASLIQRLREEPWRYDFFQAVRLLERAAQLDAAAGKKTPARPVGYDHAPAEEAVRFRALPSLAFPSAEIAAILGDEAGAVAEPLRMIVAFLGLTGPAGVLPEHYTAMVISRIRDRDYALREFLDLFTHRTVSLFYRAWEKYRFAYGYERMRRADSPDDDCFTTCLYSLVGLGTGKLRRRLAFDDETFLYYAGHFAHFPRSATSLEILLADYFELRVAVRQFCGQWLTLEPDDYSLLPSRQLREGRNNQQGVNMVIGERVWDIESKFRVRVGPLTYRQFCRFMPSGDRLTPLCQMVRSYVGPHLDFDVQVVLQAKEVPRCRLGNRADPARLGWNAWVRSVDFEVDVDDAVFCLKG